MTDGTPRGDSHAPLEASVDLGPLDPQRPEVGKPAPNFALIDARDGTTVRKLSDYTGKTVVVNWYASWCEPCKDEIGLGDCLEFLSDVSGAPFDVDWASLNAAGVDRDAPVNVRLYNTRFGDAIPMVLGSRPGVVDSMAGRRDF